MIALRYYAEAAKAALLHFSPALCIGLTERALVLLRQAPSRQSEGACNEDQSIYAPGESMKFGGNYWAST
ncbi:hypothetical protein D3C84_226310 [compost metagenome]